MTAILNTLLKEKGMTAYELSKRSGVTWSVISDLCTGKSDFNNIKVRTAVSIAHTLGYSVEEMINIRAAENGQDFDLFKSEMCHKLKRRGEIGMIIYILEERLIDRYIEEEEYPRALYCLAMLDYLSKRNDVPPCTDYDELRTKKLSRPLYPKSAWISYKIKKDTSYFKKCRKDAIPEFLKYNIVEGDVFNVI